ncbi:MAG: threonine dehydratase [Pseudomonadota bacterium]|jgi:threonine dehydratase
MTLPIEFADVQAAAERIRDHAVRTPVLRSDEADRRTGGQLFFKCENLQRTGAFKFRGAFSALSRLDSKARSKGVIAFSSGNHAQAIALAARLLEMPALIVMPKDAPPLKIAATRSHGAEIVLYDRYTEDREAIGRALSSERGMTLVPPYDHVDVMAGQGTAALELFESVGALDQLVVCVGGGGLISGCATAARALAPDCTVIGVEPEAGDDVRQSLKRGERVRIEVPQTIADGAQTQSPGVLTFEVIRNTVHDVVTVSDQALIRTLNWLSTHLKIVVEPTGCLAAAAVLEQIIDCRNKRVGIVLSGGNVDPSRLCQYLNVGLTAPA